jgi:hypothetical protein
MLARIIVALAVDHLNEGARLLPMTKRSLMYSPLISRIRPTTMCVLAATGAALTIAVSATTQAATSAPVGGKGTVTIDNCHIKRSSAAGGFTWFYCGVVADAPAKVNVSVNYKVNLSTFQPSTGGTWDKGSGTIRFTGGGESLENLKFAVGNLSIAQVKSKLRVTLSGARGATITRASATGS